VVAASMFNFMPAAAASRRSLDRAEARWGTQTRSARTPSRNRACDDRPLRRNARRGRPAVPRPTPSPSRSRAPCPTTHPKASTLTACAMACVSWSSKSQLHALDHGCRGFHLGACARGVGLEVLVEKPRELFRGGVVGRFVAQLSRGRRISWVRWGLR
jgi:hypothetical protein